MSDPILWVPSYVPCPAALCAVFNCEWGRSLSSNPETGDTTVSRYCQVHELLRREEYKQQGGAEVLRLETK